MLLVQGQDLATGNLTAPVLFALESQCGEELIDLIDSEFVEEGDLQRAIELVKIGGGLAAAKQLATEEADKVFTCFVSAGDKLAAVCMCDQVAQLLAAHILQRMLYQCFDACLQLV